MVAGEGVNQGGITDAVEINVPGVVPAAIAFFGDGEDFDLGEGAIANRLHQIRR